MSNNIIAWCGGYLRVTICNHAQPHRLYSYSLVIITCACNLHAKCAKHAHKKMLVGLMIHVSHNVEPLTLNSYMNILK